MIKKTRYFETYDFDRRFFYETRIRHQKSDNNAESEKTIEVN